MTHFTNKESTRKRHFWRLDSKCITMFMVRGLINFICSQSMHITHSLALHHTLHCVPRPRPGPPTTASCS